jgi:hypothetical protein
MSFPVGPFETSETQLAFALMLRDGLTLADALAGEVTVMAGAQKGQQKSVTGTFLFFQLPKGALQLAVRSNPDTPYYLPVDLTVTIPPPSPLWPAFPDISLADKTLPLSDPKQPSAYRAQFLQTCLSPTTAYPFDAGATLVRGTVLHADAPLAGVKLFVPADNTVLPYATAADGQFVLLFPQPVAQPTAVTIRAQRAGNTDVDTQVTVARAATVTARINL